jgi:hypothetical protein
MESRISLVGEIKQFVDDISKDLLPLEERLYVQRRATGCNYLKAPLPLDNSFLKELLITQELNSVGDDAKHFFDEIVISRRNLPQDLPIYASAATSGVGKTHLAYATGKYLTMLLIRVASGFSISDSSLSVPWRSLIEILLPLNQPRENSLGGSNSDNSEKALAYIKLLIYSYVEATLIALEHGKGSPWNLGRDRLRELALRFNRNGRGEACVKQLFVTNCAEESTGGKIGPSLDRTKTILRTYREQLHARFQTVFHFPNDIPDQKEILLVCFDEIQELLGKFPYLFIQKSVFGPHDNDIDDDNSRDLFYGVACAMGSLTRNCSWTMHMTGTSLSISKLRARNGVSTSLLRNQIQEVRIKGSLLNAASMKDMIQFYWDIPDNVFTEEVFDALNRYRGRPYFFVEGPFRAILENSRNEMTSALLRGTILSRFEWLEQIIDRRVTKMFEFNRPIAGPGDRTVTAVIPTLLKSLICGNGKIVFRDDPDISRAIIDGVILASPDMAEIDIRETEPIVYHCLMKFLSKVEIDRLLHLVLNQIRLGSGATAEEMFCYWLSLTTYVHMREINSGGMPLGDLLAALYDGDNPDHFPRRLLNEYLSQATKVVNLTNTSFHDQLDILANDGKITSINSTVIFYKIDVLCGLDIAFVVQNRKTNNYKLVAVQSKNDKSITVKQALMTLSPGTQYLQNDFRTFVITKKFPGKTPARRQCGPGFANFDSWYEFCTTYNSSIGNNWIRVALVCRRIDNAIHQYTSTEQFLERYDEKTRGIYWILFAGRQKRLDRIQTRDTVAFVNTLSPLVFLSLSAPNWLTSELKDRFVNIEEMDGGITFPNEKKKCKFWVPITVEDSRAALIAFDSGG